MMIVIYVLLYIVIGIGVITVMIRTLCEAFPEIINDITQDVQDDYDEIERNSNSKIMADFKYAIKRGLLPLVIWPIIAILMIIVSLIGKARRL